MKNVRRRMRLMPMVFVLAASSLALGCTLAPFSTGNHGQGNTGGGTSNGIFPLKLSANHRYLVDQNGVPFLVKEASSWGLIQCLSEADAAAYMDGLLQRGFNTLLVSIISYDIRMAGNPPDWQGVSPFKTQWDFSTPNETYFAHADRVINMAKARNMLVLLVPCYLGSKVPSTEGWWTYLVDATNGPSGDVSKSQAYGEYLGNRYKDFSNIIWVAGGDNSPDPGSELENRMYAIAQGIKENDAHMWTAHWGPSTWSTDQGRFAPLMDINGWYEFQEPPIQYVSELTQYNNSSQRMIFQLDQSYETENQGDPPTIRRKNYDGMLSGCAGTSFNAGPDWYEFFNWRGDTNTPGTLQTQYCFNLFDSRPWYDLIPDQQSTVVTAGRGTYGDADYVCAARTSNGGTVIAYVPANRTVTVDMSRISGSQAKAWWYDPTSGAAAAAVIGTIPTSGSQTFGPFTGDLVLVIDDASLNLPPPGTTGQSTPIPTSILVTPYVASVEVTAQLPFVALALDQYGLPLSPQPSFAWSVSGGGTFDANGVFTAGTTVSGPFTVKAMAYGLNGTASVTVIPAGPISIGETNILTNDDDSNGLHIVAQQVTLGKRATIENLSFYVTVASGLLRLGIYDATGPGGSPGALMAQTADITTVVGWNTADVTAPALLPAGTYWLAYLPQENTLAFVKAGYGSYWIVDCPYGDMPATFPAGATSGADHWSFYATLLPQP